MKIYIFATKVKIKYFFIKYIYFIAMETKRSRRKKKKYRVKLICMVQDKKFLVASTKWIDYMYSLLGGVIENFHDFKDQSSRFDNIIKTLEREVHEETAGVVNIVFDKQYISIKNGFTIFLPFHYMGCFQDLDTFLIFIYIPKFCESYVSIIDNNIKEEQNQIFNEIFGIPVDFGIGHKIVEYMHKNDYSFLKFDTFHIINDIKSKYEKNHYYLEKTGMKILTMTEFFDENVVWEWKKLNKIFVKEQIMKLINYKSI
jgi:hypothetical protein